MPRVDVGDFGLFCRVFYAATTGTCCRVHHAIAEAGSLDARASLVDLALFFTLGVYLHAVFADGARQPTGLLPDGSGLAEFGGALGLLSSAHGCACLGNRLEAVPQLILFEAI